jgi:hypothetical protein
VPYTCGYETPGYSADTLIPSAIVNPVYVAVLALTQTVCPLDAAPMPVLISVAAVAQEL